MLFDVIFKTHSTVASDGGSVHVPYIQINTIAGEPVFTFIKSNVIKYLPRPWREALDFPLKSGLIGVSRFPANYFSEAKRCRIRSISQIERSFRMI